VQRLARALAERGHDVTVLAASERFDAYDTDDHGARVVRIASRKNPFWRANPVPLISLGRFERFVAAEQPDIIHAHDALPLCLQAVRARKRIGVPLVTTCHYYPSFVASYLARGSRSHRVVEGLAWRYSIALYNRVDCVVFPTFTHRDSFVERGLEPPTKVVSNGVDLVRYSPGVTPEDLDGRYSLPKGRRVLVVGRLAKDKDLDVVIKSIAQVDSTPSTHLLVVGDGPHGDALAACARELGVEERVHFLGFVPESDLPDIYRASDVFAISSCHEVQSIPALQAAATGLPIVAVAEGSLSEVCRNGENGLLVPARDPASFAAALDTALDSTVGSHMAQASLALSTLHDERKTFDSYESLYRRILERETAPESPSAPEHLASVAAAGRDSPDG